MGPGIAGPRGALLPWFDLLCIVPAEQPFWQGFDHKNVPAVRGIYQADPSLCWVHSHFVGFVMLWLKCTCMKD